MQVFDLLPRRAIELDMTPASKTEWIEQLVDVLMRGYPLRSPSARAEILRAVLEREETHTTAIGNGVALPHAKTDAAPKVIVAFGRAPQGVEFDAPDGKLVYAAFLLVSPRTATSAHVQALAGISRVMIRDGVLDGVMKAKRRRDFIRVVKAAEEEL